ncbi:hypothetical protein Esti_004245 [Eimeria stiedai]
MVGAARGGGGGSSLDVRASTESTLFSGPQEDVLLRRSSRSSGVGVPESKRRISAKLVQPAASAMMFRATRGRPEEYTSTRLSGGQARVRLAVATLPKGQQWAVREVELNHFRFLSSFVTLDGVTLLDCCSPHPESIKSE